MMPTPASLAVAKEEVRFRPFGAAWQRAWVVFGAYAVDHPRIAACRAIWCCWKGALLLLLRSVRENHSAGKLWRYERCATPCNVSVCCIVCSISECSFVVRVRVWSCPSAETACRAPRRMLLKSH